MLAAGLPQFDNTRSSRSSSNCSLNSGYTDTLSLVPELDRCPSLVAPSRSNSFYEQQPHPDSTPDRIQNRNQGRSRSMMDLRDMRKRRKRKLVRSRIEEDQNLKLPPGGVTERVKTGSVTQTGSGLEFEMSQLTVNDGESVKLPAVEDHAEGDVVKEEIKTFDFDSKRGSERSRTYSLSENKSGLKPMRNSSLGVTRSSPCVWLEAEIVNGSASNGIGGTEGLLHGQEPNFTDQASSISSLDEPAGDSVPFLVGNDKDSPTSGEEFYQTFIEGDVDCAVSPSLNWSTHPMLMKSHSTPVGTVGADALLDDVILPSPISKQDTFNFSEMNCTLNNANHQTMANRNATSRDSYPGDYYIDLSEECRDVPTDLVGNRVSDSSLRSMESQASRFSYSDLPGMAVSFPSDEYEVTEL